MKVVNIHGSWFAFVVFGAPVYQLGSAHIRLILFGGAGVSEVSLLTAGEAHTLYASLGPGTVGLNDVSPCLSSTSSSPIPSRGSWSVYIHGYWLVVPSWWHGTGVVGHLAKALAVLL
jgi:hypothetical protein